MSTEQTTQILVLHESIASSLIRDVASYGGLLAVVGIGIWLDSAALQWIAGCLWIFCFLGRVMGTAKTGRMTPQQAADMLATRFGVRAGEA